MTLSFLWHYSLTQDHYALHRKSAEKGNKTTDKGHIVIDLPGCNSASGAQSAQLLSAVPLSFGVEFGANYAHGDALEEAQLSASLSSTAALAASLSSSAALAAGQQAVYSDGLIRPTLSAEALGQRRSSKSLWGMANMHVQDTRDHFKKPPKDLNQLHRPMLCNLSYWCLYFCQFVATVITLACPISSNVSLPITD